MIIIKSLFGLVVLLTLLWYLSLGSLVRLDMNLGMVLQCNPSSNTKLEDSTVKTPKTDSYVPVSALCAESTYSNIVLKLKSIRIRSNRHVKLIEYETNVF